MRAYHDVALATTLLLPAPSFLTSPAHCERTMAKQTKETQFAKLGEADQKRVKQKLITRAERDERDERRFLDPTTRRNELRNEQRRNVAQRKRIAREEAIPEEEKVFRAQYHAACDEGKPAKAEIKQPLNTHDRIDLWSEVEAILAVHRS